MQSSEPGFQHASDAAALFATPVGEDQDTDDTSGPVSRGGSDAEELEEHATVSSTFLHVTVYS